ncbi:M61 family metallopeptidase [Pedobacter nutrimenti]|jgi:predicted metalloprotease with PDZ domain|uniref:Putative metalloprotease with PDZ domain n=1 Tax=Pedobacter nutrimenti TaxID=1241337 RepID=A0A318UTL1_9SPHI|nr:peptidase M61 [Pedobacter nutrimenti]PYF74969.1 putative metalloprotease with PDZ domain [Pedobacter nutrimenti]
MKKYLFYFLLLAGASPVFAQKSTTSYQYSLDLNNVKEDKLEVTLLTPKLKTAETTFHLPKMVPGTYAIYDFGRYVSNFKAFDKSGKELSVVQGDVNSWKIADATKLAKITYLVDDSWDSPEIKGPEIFQPAGTNIDKDKMFAINNFGFFGYFDGQKSVPFEVTITKPADFYGSTSLKAKHVNATTDQYLVPDYYSLADAPIMYNKPDTTILHIGGAEILISLYSPNHKATSAIIAKELKRTIEAQKEYLGGKLPVDKYAFIISLTDNPKIRSYGALEHSYSSFYFLPEGFTPEKLAQTVRETGSHEFFHIVTPLSIHSEEIGNFDYDHPKMSEHLWMYEGLTEYAAHHMQVKYGLVDFKDYLKTQGQKLNNTRRYNDTLAFTRMSKGVLDTFENQYGNVYEKGALIGLCLDIKLRELSKGKYGTQNLMKDLSKTYGKTKSFKDEELFATITKLTYPEIGAFLNTYVAGTKKLPYKEVFASIGVDYEPVVNIKRANMGDVRMGYNPATKNLFVADTTMNSYGKKLGFQKGDQILAINDVKLPEISQVQQFLDNVRQSAKAGDTFSVLVLRKDANGNSSEVKLSQPVELQDAKLYNVLKEFPTLTEDQKALRAAWLNTKNN